MNTIENGAIARGANKGLSFTETEKCAAKNGIAGFGPANPRAAPTLPTALAAGQNIILKENGFDSS